MIIQDIFYTVTFMIEEFLKLKRVFKNILSLLQEFIEWFNNHRYHMGIHDYPASVYFSKNVTDVT